ncbi:uncharacterized protein IL334_004875 [Kwoniella shivajii]|uniref:Origin recognition complex subunit 6 n=1 Tax=Kwoniella shivajii TaxID=564305 RepID=A0ABZ1D1J9_9TREE|nr:hypothetical protein IL334_004875 [Kwoniella shivajii]
MSSTTELIPLFPSATHPAIPISAQILSTLRHLTAPGKGNDLKPEERAALVGVSALLGCEKIQSKDLPISSAQKASSVSPAHFRSTLSRCRIILENIPSSPSSKRSPSKRSPAKAKRSGPIETQSSSSDPTNITSDSASRKEGTLQTEDRGVGEDDTGIITPSVTVRTEDILSPLQTPKKKYKFSSGIDISSLIKTPQHRTTPKTHDPVIASPLRQSVTRQPSAKYPNPNNSIVDEPTSPSQLNKKRSTNEKEEADGNDDDDDDDDEENELGTPTKKIKYSVPQGVDLEHPPSVIRSVQSQRQRTSRKGNQENSNAFFALRPGSTTTITATATMTSGKESEQVGRDHQGESWMHRRPEETHYSQSTGNRKVRVQGEKKKKSIRKIDWTYTESVWGKSMDTNLDKIWQELDTYFDKRDLPNIENTEVPGEGI